MAEEAGLRADRPGSHLMHKDVCTASALPGSEAGASQQNSAPAPKQIAAVGTGSEERLPQTVLRDESKPREGLIVDRKHPLGAIRRKPVEIAEGKTRDPKYHPAACRMVCRH